MMTPSSEPMTSTEAYLNTLESKGGLHAQGLLKALPIHHGMVLKLHVPFMFSCLPRTMQDYVTSDSRIFSLIAPEWKERDLILCGNYLYRFLNLSSKSPKGSPIDVQSVQAHILSVDDDDDDEDGIISILGNLPPGVDTVFCLSSFGKRRYFATRSREDAVTWVNSVRERRQEVIKESMGHSQVPQPHSWAYFDGLARDMLRRRDRIHARERQMESRNYDFAGYGGGGTAAVFM